MVGSMTRARPAEGRPAMPVLMRLLLGALLIGMIAPAVAEEADKPLANPVERQPLREMAATHERPLFSPTRRPPPKIVPPVVARQETPPPPPAPPPSLVVLGIVSEDGAARAVLRAADKQPTDKTLRVRMGDDVGGWTVDKIEPRRLVLTQGERSVDFVLFGAANKAIKSADATVRTRRDRR